MIVLDSKEEQQWLEAQTSEFVIIQPGRSKGIETEDIWDTFYYATLFWWDTEKQQDMEKKEFEDFILKHKTEFKWKLLTNTCGQQQKNESFIPE